MWHSPFARQNVVFQSSVRLRPVTAFTNKFEKQLIASVSANGKPYRIDCPFFGHARAPGSVAQIAEFPQFISRRFGAFVAGCATLALPSTAQRQP
jgi:hypothetical protein